MRTPSAWSTFTYYESTHRYDPPPTRFLSLAMNESSAQTTAIAIAELTGTKSAPGPDLSTWHEAVRLLGKYKVTLHFPKWFEFVASKLPASQVRVRRDWRRFLAFCRVISICRSWSESNTRQKDIVCDFSDYCVAYRILATAFASTVHEVHERELLIADIVRKLHARLTRSVTVQEVAGQLTVERKPGLQIRAKSGKAFSRQI